MRSIQIEPVFGNKAISVALKSGMCMVLAGFLVLLSIHNLLAQKIS